MKLPTWLKIGWWFLLVGFFSHLLYQRYDSIMTGAATATDIVIFLILIALITIPLFHEVSLFGVGFRKEIDNLRTDVREQIINLRSEIQNTINMRAEISPQIYLAPPTDSELPSIEERIRPILEQVLKEQGIERPVLPPEDRIVPDNTQYLFSVRYALEKELRRIWQDSKTEIILWKGQRASDVEWRPRPFVQILQFLSDSGILVPEVHNGIREVYAICSSAIHGGDISEAKINFVRDVALGLIESLKAVKRLPSSRTGSKET
jgi:hypothetical protein